VAVPFKETLPPPEATTGGWPLAAPPSEGQHAEVAVDLGPCRYRSRARRQLGKLTTMRPLLVLVVIYVLLYALERPALPMPLASLPRPLIARPLAAANNQCSPVGPLYRDMHTFHMSDELIGARDSQ
jgi:hypothetical protein